MCVRAYTIRARWTGEGVSLMSYSVTRRARDVRGFRGKNILYFWQRAEYTDDAFYLFFLLLLFFSYDYCYGVRVRILPSEIERLKGHRFVPECQ